jgi:hypothetical protein
MYCNNCGAQNPEGSSFCSKCGNRLTPAQVMPQQTPAAATPARKTNGLAIAALVLGIASFVPPLAICSIPAIIMGAIALNQIKKDPALEGRGMALAGLICGSIVLFLWICLIILFIVLAATSTTTTSDFWVSAISLSALI